MAISSLKKLISPLIGLKGELSEIRGKNKFILRIKELNTSFTVELPGSQPSAIPVENIENQYPRLN